MAKIEDLFTLVGDLLDEVDAYKYDVEVLHRDNSFREFEYSRGQKNYDSIIRRLKSIDIPEPEVLLSKTIELEEFKEYFVTILRIILGEKYEDDIRIAKTFITPKDYSHNVDVKTGYKDIRGISTPCEFVVSKNLNHIQLAHIINSEITVLLRPLYKDFAHTITNIHYQRFPGIIATYIAIYELSKILKSENLIGDYEQLYISDDSIQAKNKYEEIIYALPKFRQKDVLEHYEHNRFSFLVSHIYSTSLIEAYLNDEVEFFKKFRTMIAGEISIPDYLDYYGLNLKDKNVTLKYLNKVDEVEKGC